VSQSAELVVPSLSRRIWIADPQRHLFHRNCRLLTK